LASGIFRAVAAIAGEVTTQYILRYIPEVENSKRNSKVFHNVKVTVPNYPTVRVRARKGYYPLNP
jgi:hypothetical protein